MKTLQRKAFYLLLLCFLAAGSSLKAQVNIQWLPALPVQLRLSDMWRVQIMNSSATAQTVYLKSVVSHSNGSFIVEGSSEPFSLKPGPNLISAAALNLKPYYYNQAERLNGLSATESFPFGAYTLCMRVFLADNSSELALACQEVDIKPLSPPMLLNPYHQSSVYHAYPLLMWTAPAPMPAGMQVSYDLRLVEILGGQTASDAIQRNFALLDMKDLRQTFFQYPANAVKLEKNKQYAWQIVAKGDEYLIGSTEVWSFSLASDSPGTETARPDQFYKLKSQVDGGYGIAIESLGITYEEAYVPGQMQITVYNAQHQPLNIKDLSMSRLYGDNRFVINLKESGKFKNGQFYFLEIRGAKGDKGIILFKYYSSRKKFEQDNKSKAVE